MHHACLVGTFAPARRASDNPIAIACLRLVTFLPVLPLFRVPCFLSCITFFTFAAAFFPYLAMKLSPLVFKPIILSTSLPCTPADQFADGFAQFGRALGHGLELIRK